MLMILNLTRVHTQLYTSLVEMTAKTTHKTAAPRPLSDTDKRC